jgi:hypothetical protein
MKPKRSPVWYVLILIALAAAFLAGVLYAQPRLIDDGHALSFWPPLVIVRAEDPEIGAWCWIVYLPWSPEWTAVDCEPESAFDE